jgi:hypothetical protein
MVIVNCRLVHISKSTALRFVFWNLFQHYGFTEDALFICFFGFLTVSHVAAMPLHTLFLEQWIEEKLSYGLPVISVGISMFPLLDHCNYGWVHISKSVALTFLFWNLLQHLPITYWSTLMLIIYCGMLTLITYCPVLMVLTDALHLYWNGFVSQCFLCYRQTWSSVYLGDEILSLVIGLGLNTRIIGQRTRWGGAKPVIYVSRAHMR